MVDIDTTQLESLLRKHAQKEMDGVDPAVMRDCTQGACGDLRQSTTRGRSK